MVLTNLGSALEEIERLELKILDLQIRLLDAQQANGALIKSERVARDVNGDLSQKNEELKRKLNSIRNVLEFR
jgi:uncharacterized lipoprotein YajG